MEFSYRSLNFRIPRVVQHILFWVAYYAFFLVQSIYLRRNPLLGPIALQLFLTMFVDIGATYLTVYVLLPRFLMKRRYLLFFISWLCSAPIFILMQRMILFYITYPMLYPGEVSSLKFFVFNPFYSFFNIYAVVGFFAAFKMLKYWYEDQRIRSELENQNKTSELALLRTQINPHFLFNTLNNIDSLIPRDPEKASDAVIRLSEIMRYMLYEANTEKVLLEREIEYLQSYIALQQLRLKSKDFVSLSVEGDYQGIRIAPMLLIPFVENAFKHGSRNISTPGITVRLYVNHVYVNFEVTNFISEQSRLAGDITPGIGLSNVRRRLELIYPGRHDLMISHDNGIFHVRLKLPIR
ncbi:MAG: histidine kinase [Bacteroidales bacterium]|nr:histidine kinase [Bacteroidales bacterium]